LNQLFAIITSHPESAGHIQFTMVLTPLDPITFAETGFTHRGTIKKPAVAGANGTGMTKFCLVPFKP
jgi:hypothetical protein